MRNQSKYFKRAQFKYVSAVIYARGRRLNSNEFFVEP